ncbi:MAG TPA: hypothetical protein VG795_08660 [Acidimicrobiia bacterium]|nr:hypothetical protein [Acidimicrobiia bacterium]
MRPRTAKRLTGAHSVRPPSNQGFKVAAAVVVPLLVAAALIALVASFTKDDDGSSASSSSTTTVTASKEATDFRARIDEAFKPLAESVTLFLPKAQEFTTGQMTPADFKATVDMALPEWIKVRDAVAALPPYKPKPVINRYFVDSADLYVETARIYTVAVDPAAEALRPQLNLAARRVRTLADRIYDRGRTVLDPAFYPAPTEAVEQRPPTEVPDWVAEGMAAGPPLAEPPGPAASEIPSREPTCGKGVAPPCRAEESKKKWESRVKDAGFPQPPDVARALDAGDATKLGELAASYETKTRILRAGPDPKGDRERAAAVGIGLLTNGEAARLGQAAALLPAGDIRNRLLAVARRALVVGDDLLQPGLGFQRSGLPASLLQDSGP